MNLNLSTLRRVLDSACRIYAVLTLLLCIGQLLFGASDFAINPLSFLMLFPFSVCFAWGYLLRRSDKLSAGMQLLSQFIVITAGVMLCLYWPAEVFSSGRSALVMVFAYLLVYLLLLLSAAGIRTLLRRRKAEKSAYTAQYNDLREKK